MSCPPIALSHWVVGIVGPDSVFVLSQLLLQLAFGASNIQIATFTFQSVNNIRCVAVSKISALECSATKTSTNMLVLLMLLQWLQEPRLYVPKGFGYQVVGLRGERWLLTNMSLSMRAPLKEEAGRS